MTDKPKDPGTEVATVTPSRLLELAVEKGADIESMTKLLDLQERWEANEAKKAYEVAIAEFKKEPPTLVRDKDVSFGTTSYSHASLDQISAVIGKALAAQGLSHRWKVNQTDNFIGVTCVISHVLGHSEGTYMQAQPDQSGGKNAIQAVGSTTTYLERYTLLAATGLAVQDQDDDGAGATAMISDEEKATIVAKMKETSADTARFLKYMGVKSVDEIRASEFNKAMEALKTVAAKKEKEKAT